MKSGTFVHKIFLFGILSSQSNNCREHGGYEHKILKDSLLRDYYCMDSKILIIYERGDYSYFEHLTLLKKQISQVLADT